MENQPADIDLRDYVLTIAKKWRQILGAFLIIFIITGLIALNVPKKYQTQALLKIASLEYAQDYSQDLITIFSHPHTSEAIASLSTQDNPITAGQIAGQTQLATTGDFLQIKVQGKNPQQTADIMKLVWQFINQDYQKKIGQELANIDAQIKKQTSRLETITAEQKLVRQKVDLWEQTFSQARAMVTLSYISRLFALSGEKNSLQEEIYKLEAQKEKIQTSAIIIAPSDTATSSRPLSYNLSLAFILSIFIAIILVAVKEYFTTKPEY